jgi:hypothetical protein
MNPKNGERPSLEAATKQRLVETETENTSLCDNDLCSVVTSCIIVQ